MKRWITGLALTALFALGTLAVAQNRMEGQGSIWAVGSGGVLDIESGGELRIAGTAITSSAAELNSVDGSTAAAAELNYLDITTLGTGAASKAVVLDASGDYTYPATGTIIYPSSATLTLQSGSTFNVAGTFQVGGTAVGATAAELNAAADVSVRRIAVADGNYQMLVANSGKPHIVANVTADRTFTFPAEADGLEYEFIADVNAADDFDWIFTTESDTNYFTGGVIHLDTDADGAGDEVVAVFPDGNSNSKLQINLPQGSTRIKFVSNGTTWTVTGYVVSATAPTFADQ